MPAHASRTLVSGTIFVLLATTSALALDADDFGRKFADTVAFMGIGIVHGAATARGDTVTLGDLTLNVPGEAPEPVGGEIVFEGVVENGDGSYSVARASIADIEVEDHQAAVSLRNVEATGLEIPASISLENAVEVSMSLYERISMGPLDIRSQDELTVSVESMALWFDPPGPDGTVRNGFEIAGIVADLSGISDPEAKAVIEALGMEQLKGSMHIYGTWNEQAARLTFDGIRFDLVDQGRLDFDVAMTGVTRSLWQETIRVNQEMLELTRAGHAPGSAELNRLDQRMAEQAIAVNIESLSIRYDDASLFGKVMGLMATQQGVQPEVIAAGVKIAAASFLGELQVAEFSAMATAAVGTFVDDPGNIALSAEPAVPVGLQEIIETADPAALIDLLNVSVHANR